MPTIKIPGEPKGKGRPRFTTAGGHAHAITPADTAKYENLVKLEWKAHVKEPPIPAGEPVCVRIDAFYGVPKSASRKKRTAMLVGDIRPTKKPDVDNIIKIICDALNGLAYHDDAQIVSVSCEKHYAESTPRVYVTVEKFREC